MAIYTLWWHQSSFFQTLLRVEEARALQLCLSMAMIIAHIHHVLQRCQFNQMLSPQGDPLGLQMPLL